MTEQLSVIQKKVVPKAINHHSINTYYIRMHFRDRPNLGTRCGRFRGLNNVTI